MNLGSNHICPSQLPEVPGVFVCRELREVVKVVSAMRVQRSMFYKVLNGKVSTRARKITRRLGVRRMREIRLDGFDRFQGASLGLPDRA